MKPNIEYRRQRGQSSQDSRNAQRSEPNSQQQQNQTSKISNRQKILNLHQRIKMLDQNNFSSVDHSQAFQAVRNRTIKMDDQQERSLNQNDQMTKLSSTLLKRPVSPNALQNYAENGKSKNSQSYKKNNLETITTHYPNFSANQQASTNQLTQNPSFLNRSLKSQHSLSAPRLPSYSPGPKQFQESFRTTQPIHMTSLFPLQARYLSIEDKYLQFKLSEQNLIKNIEQEIEDLQQNCKKFKKQFEKAEKTIDQCIDNIETSLNGEINQLSLELKEVRKGAIESLDTKYKAIKCETIAMITEEFQSQCKSASVQIQSQLEAAHKMLEKEQSLRDETAEFLINSFADEMIKLQEVLNMERQTRSHKNDQLLKMINKVEEDLMDRLQLQKREMISNIEQMQNMLQKVCYKIQQRILGNE